MILGICGKKGAGKDYVAKLIQTAYPDHKIVHFADPLKYHLASLLGIDPSHFFSSDKDTIYYNVRTLTLEDTPNQDNVLLRVLLQKFGTEMVRKHISYNFWVEKLFQTEHENIIIPDVRFKNEAGAILDRGGELLKVVRTDIPNDDKHRSETDLDDYPMDYTIINNPTCDELLIEQLKNLKLWAKQ